MKKLFVILLALSLSAIALQSCKKDEKLAKTENTVKINGESFLVNHTKSIEGYLKNNQVVINLSQILDDNKKIKQVNIGIDYNEQNNIEGEYFYPEQNGKKNIKKDDTFLQIMGSNEYYKANINSGTLKITHNEKDNYTLDIDFKTEKGDHIIGSISDNFDIILK